VELAEAHCEPSRQQRFAVHEEQVIWILGEQEAGLKTADVFRKYGIGPTTF
jgi:hypothetical protein